jgi:hypothetical protein
VLLVLGEAEALIPWKRRSVTSPADQYPGEGQVREKAHWDVPRIPVIKGRGKIPNRGPIGIMMFAPCSTGAWVETRF